ncbi:DUF192 domain-containing protein [Mangrovimonas sp. DI 80]|uniref:DUF192 domain-containing protein n=1 Tax=Mangrovimonas sp. DI 80 TaxID=1779330 RepID=UPI00097589D6|nr:DUF192 domain-containing protein [Mangrovimonas sp. DI 80]OMP30328.1 hypothetical protein BKM32_13175 [Mangrovimonas sp. DI 80]
MRKISIGGLLLLSMFMALMAISCKNEPKVVKEIIVEFKKEGTLSLYKAASDSLVKTISIEIADDDYQTQTGLMYRNSMENNQGMLFIFPREEFHSFYMKNTRIPLDIIFIDKDKTIINIQKNAKPFDETSLPSTAPAQYVLEINGGLSDEWNLSAGDRIDFTRL